MSVWQFCNTLEKTKDKIKLFPLKDEETIHAFTT
jgi:hypothetical protein